MTPLPSTSVALFDADGGATVVLRELLRPLGEVPRGALLDRTGRAQSVFRRFLAGIATKPLPNQMATLADTSGRPTRVFTMLLAGLP